jgi:hypothetical protein
MTGNAVNFLHGASVGPYIFFLVQAEILAGIRMLTRVTSLPACTRFPRPVPARSLRDPAGPRRRDRGDLALLLQQVIDLAITPDHIRTTLTAYLDTHPNEKPDLAPVLDLLDAGGDLTSRKEFRGHVTAGAILADTAGRILHIHHRTLDT